MKVLLDTHALAWFALNAPQLSAGARRAIEDEAEVSFVSAVSAYEIATKVRLGRWPEAQSLALGYDDEVTAEGFRLLPITSEHARRAGLFAHPHRDPFDRLLAAQALAEGLTIVSRDAALDAFGVVRLW